MPLQKDLDHDEIVSLALAIRGLVTRVVDADTCLDAVLTGSVQTVLNKQGSALGCKLLPHPTLPVRRPLELLGRGEAEFLADLRQAGV